MHNLHKKCGILIERANSHGTRPCLVSAPWGWTWLCAGHVYHAKTRIRHVVGWASLAFATVLAAFRCCRDFLPAGHVKKHFWAGTLYAFADRSVDPRLFHSRQHAGDVCRHVGSANLKLAKVKEREIPTNSI